MAGAVPASSRNGMFLCQLGMRLVEKGLPTRGPSAWRWILLLLLVAASAVAHWMLMQGAVSHQVSTSVTVAASHALLAPSIQHTNSTSSNNSSSHTDRGIDTTNIRIFVGVLSTSNSTASRDVIRQTWGAESRLGRVMFFVLRPKNDTEFTQLRQEAVTRGDVVIVTEVYEDFHNTTYATLEIFKTAVRIGGFTHMVKTDDDAYVRWPLLFDALASMPQQRLYAGSPMIYERVPRGWGRHAVPLSNWPSHAPVKYAVGLGYVLTIDLVRDIVLGGAHSVMAPRNLLIIEDMAVGYWVAAVARLCQYKVNYVTYGIGLRDCRPDQVFVHLPVRPVDTIRCMHSTGGQCCKDFLPHTQPKDGHNTSVSMLHHTTQTRPDEGPLHEPPAGQGTFSPFRGHHTGRIP